MSPPEPVTYGIDGVQLAQKAHPTLFPPLAALVVRAPDPPLLEEDWSNHQRVTFLVNAFTSFLDAHFAPYAAVKQSRIRALAALSGEPRGRPTFEKLRVAAEVMSGDAWGELAPRVRAGKLPQAIAPHAWLLWRAQCWAMGLAKGAGCALTIDRAFNANDLLSESTLRTFSHTAPDPVLGAVRSGSALPSFVGQAERALAARKHLVYRFGYSSDTLRWVLRQRGDALADYDLLALYERERQAVREQEEQLRAAARRGTWVWGRWIPPARSAGRRQQRLTTAIAQDSA